MPSMKSILTQIQSITCLLLLGSGLGSLHASPVFQDDFQRQEADEAVEDVGFEWRTNSDKRAKGDKQADLKGSYLQVTTSPRADHAATVVRDIALDDCLVKLRFKINKGDSIAFNFNDKDLSKLSHAGHVCNVRINLNKILLADQMNGVFLMERYERKKAGADPQAIKAEVAAFEKSAPLKLGEGEWHDLEIQIKGATLTATINGNTTIAHTSPGFDHPTKTHIALSVAKQAAFDDVEIWDEAEPE